MQVPNLQLWVIALLITAFLLLILYLIKKEKYKLKYYFVIFILTYIIIYVVLMYLKNNNFNYEKFKIGGNNKNKLGTIPEGVEIEGLDIDSKIPDF